MLPTKGLSGAPDPDRDGALSEEVEVVDVEHPLFGRALIDFSSDSNVRRVARESKLPIRPDVVVADWRDRS